MNNAPAPTEEQQAIIDTFLTGGDLVVQAGAGTGKTTVIGMLAEVMAARGMYGHYITLNKSVAEEVATKFTYGNVSSSTFHSLAFQIANVHPYIAPLVAKMINEKNPATPSTTVSRMGIARHLGVEKVLTYRTFHESNKQIMGLPSAATTVSSIQLCHAALDALRTWCQTDDDTIGCEHVARPKTMPEDQFIDIYAPVVVDIALHAWTTDILNPAGRLPFTHDYYLKLVCMARPRITDYFGLPSGSVLFFDEAQDARPCVSGLLHAQDNLQLVAVGDSAQAIYGFTGARDALPAFSANPGTSTLPLTTSWRFGQRIADAANETLDILDAPIRLSGNPTLGDSEVIITEKEENYAFSDVSAILVRTNARLLNEAREQIAQSRKVYIATKLDELLDVIRDFKRIESGQKPITAELREFTGGMNQVLEYVNDETVDPGNPLKSLLTRFTTEGTAPTQHVIETCVKTENEADIVISTIHKAKGRQWPSVYLALDPDDITPGLNQHNRTVYDPHTRKMNSESRDALMLYYVAITRARDRLIIPGDTHAAMNALYDAHRKHENAQANSQANSIAAYSAAATNPLTD